MAVIARDLAVSERRVATVLSQLEKEGLVQVIRLGRCNSYRVDLDRGLAERLCPKGSCFGPAHLRPLQTLLKQNFLNGDLAEAPESGQ